MVKDASLISCGGTVGISRRCPETSPYLQGPSVAFVSNRRLTIFNGGEYSAHRMKLTRKTASGFSLVADVPARRLQCHPVLLWLKLIALVLVLPTFSWIALDLTPNCALDFATHMATYGEHYEPYGYHVPPEVEKPQAVRFLDAVTADLLLTRPLIALLPLDPLAQDRPPPLFSSTIPLLRAPPALIHA